MSIDKINAIFQIIGALLIWKNALLLYKVKEVKGVYWPATAFFTIWGFWNIYYFPSLGQWFSFVAGIVLTVGNLAWTIQAIYYSKLNKGK